jgi:hypothetical protein
MEIMQIKIPAVVRSFDLGEYAEEARGQTISVWVNPPAEMLREHARQMQAISQALGMADSEERMQLLEAASQKLREIIAALWSKGKDESHWTPADVFELVENTYETDPALYAWMLDKTFELINAHRTAQKKS